MEQVCLKCWNETFSYLYQNNRSCYSITKNYKYKMDPLLIKIHNLHIYSHLQNYTMWPNMLSLTWDDLNSFSYTVSIWPMWNQRKRFRKVTLNKDKSHHQFGLMVGPFSFLPSFRFKITRYTSWTWPEKWSKTVTRIIWLSHVNLS